MDFWAGWGESCIQLNHKLISKGRKDNQGHNANTKGGSASKSGHG